MWLVQEDCIKILWTEKCISSWPLIQRGKERTASHADLIAGTGTASQSYKSIICKELPHGPRNNQVKLKTLTFYRPFIILSVSWVKDMALHATLGPGCISVFWYEHQDPMNESGELFRSMDNLSDVTWYKITHGVTWAECKFTIQLTSLI